MTENQKNNSGIGRRKTAIASVFLASGENAVTLNGKKVSLPQSVLAPFKLVGHEKYSLTIKVSGGGKESQLEAIRLGIARALNKLNPDFHTTLKKEGLLTRDPREKERKKPGLRGARRAPQWAKR